MLAEPVPVLAEPVLVLVLAEPVLVLAAGTAPDTVTSCHRPPERLRPLPLFCPGALSPA